MESFVQEYFFSIVCLLSTSILMYYWLFYCPLCKTLGVTKLAFSKCKGLLRERLERDDIVKILKQQMAKCYGSSNSQHGNFA